MLSSVIQLLESEHGVEETRTNFSASEDPEEVSCSVMIAASLSKFSKTVPAVAMNGRKK